VVDADDLALEQRPEAFDAVGMVAVGDILASAVADDAVIVGAAEMAIPALLGRAPRETRVPIAMAHRRWSPRVFRDSADRRATRQPRRADLRELAIGPKPIVLRIITGDVPDPRNRLGHCSFPLR
jgi:hypothetical protein